MAIQTPFEGKIMEKEGSKAPKIKIALPSKEQIEAANRISKMFILASMTYFFIGSALGFLMLLRVVAMPSFLHAHLNLFGWVAMLIFGIGYKLIPTSYANKPALYSFKLAHVQFWFANIGLVGMLVFWQLAFYGYRALYALSVVFGAVLFLSVVLFLVNIFMTYFGKAD